MALNHACIGVSNGPYTFEYDDRTVILYALGAGATEAEPRFVFEGAPDFGVVPSFAVIPATRSLFDAVGLLDADLMRLLHGEQAIRWHRPIPTGGRLLTTWEVSNIYDKGKGALAIVTSRTSDEQGPLFDNMFSLFIRGEGGFGGDRGPEAERHDPPADRGPDFRVAAPTASTQALLYRLSGDRNPLHASPEFARMSGFERPILHGLCTLGYATRALVNAGLGGDPARLKSLSARFAGVVFPGDEIVTEGWSLPGGRWILRTTTGRGTPAISNFVAESV